MKNFLNQVFVVLGVIFLILILIGVYFFISDPYNLRPLLFPSSPAQSSQNTNTTEGDTTSSSGGFQLSEAQKQALINLGVDPSTVPASVSTEQEACFTAALGASRVAEIKRGAVPNAIEFYKTKPCI